MAIAQTRYPGRPGNVGQLNQAGQRLMSAVLVAAPASEQSNPSGPSADGAEGLRRLQRGRATTPPRAEGCKRHDRGMAVTGPTPRSVQPLAWRLSSSARAKSSGNRRHGRQLVRSVKMCAPCRQDAPAGCTPEVVLIIARDGAITVAVRGMVGYKARAGQGLITRLRRCHPRAVAIGLSVLVEAAASFAGVVVDDLRGCSHPGVES